MANQKRILKVVAWLVAIPLVYVLFLAAPYFQSALFDHNFHAVVPGRFYRSAEMSGEDLAALIAEHEIKSVIDLRLSGGESDDDGSLEARAVEGAGAIYRRAPFTSSRANQRKRMLQLLDLFDELPTPILVHCTSGSERSGVASAIWLMEKEHRPPAEACEQLALRYGFNQVERDLRSFLQGRPTLDRVVTEYAKARATREIGFREWASESSLLEEPKKR